jgi:hypothetical protein
MNTSRFLTLPRMALAFCGLAAATGVVQAAALTIDDRFDDPAPIGISANDWEDGLSINGTLFQQGLHNQATGSVDGESLSFDGRWIDEGLSVALTRTVYFVEPGTPDVISDILQYTLDPSAGGFGHIFGTFVSDSDPGGLGTVPPDTDPGDIWLEGSGNFNFGAPFMSGVVLTTPEPTSILMLIVGAALTLRRKS